ncbi:leucyl/phenylalanyl-tRNA--protein transferase [Flavimarina sp. Hel_I_48]|uniref:leucyl/phenylalanyl-tRNA--protein transferase n=1 Tax=Flavimarina sp. Hel_I_48 TaxID=1392488 RepID=UPI0004DF1E92|nr:leucyl/phenylalanyl-tRNA--protein transferase [Flavimarina sp. Hel_I_48]
MIYLGTADPFPDPALANTEGLLAVGANLAPSRLLAAYARGIFPWYNAGEPVLWWSPDPRMVLRPEEIRITKSMRKTMRDGDWEVTYNTQFLEVILHCKRIPREGQNGTWITNEMVEAYLKLHEMGHADSVEVWREGELVGGLYGINLKDRKIFCGESMFSRVSNASKVAMINLAQNLESKNYKLIDCQVYNPHLERMGAYEIPRHKFLDVLQSEDSL